MGDPNQGTGLFRVYEGGVDGTFNLVQTIEDATLPMSLGRSVALSHDAPPKINVGVPGPGLVAITERVRHHKISLVPQSQGVVSVSINSSVALDSAENANAASNTLSFLYDTVSPNATLASTS